MRSAVKIGFGFALLHAIFVGSLAHRIFVSGAGDGWLLAAFADFPAYLLLLPFTRFTPTAPESAFVFLSVWFGVAGTLQWYLIGWAAAAGMAKACGVDPKPSNQSLQLTAGRFGSSPK
jgi:hypothetical protein